MTRIIFTTTALLAFLLLFTYAPAYADEIDIRWTHPAPDTIAAYTVHIGTKPGIHPREEPLDFEINAGILTGVIDIEPNVLMYVAIVAHKDQILPDGTVKRTDSVHSNERIFYVATETGPTEPPDFTNVSGPGVVEVTVSITVGVGD